MSARGEEVSHYGVWPFRIGVMQLTSVVAASTRCSLSAIARLDEAGALRTRSGSTRRIRVGGRKNGHVERAFVHGRILPCYGLWMRDVNG